MFFLSTRWIVGFWGQLKWEKRVGGREGEKGDGAEGCSGGLRVEGWHRGLGL